jgi:very-short-patch-repair endonuclease
VLDFYCHKLKISFEVDGGYHFTREQKEKGFERTLYIRELGIQEYRFTNQQVLETFEKTIETITNMLHAVTL